MPNVYMYIYIYWTYIEINVLTQESYYINIHKKLYGNAVKVPS